MARRKGRTFEGCWTCRSRKVKCDLTKPQCNRCLKSNRICQGYEIRLGWCQPMIYDHNDTTNNDTFKFLNNEEFEKDLDNFQRRNVELVKYPKHMKYETYEQLNYILNQFDNLEMMNHDNMSKNEDKDSENEKEFTIGPFKCIKWKNINTMNFKKTSNKIMKTPQKSQPLIKPQNESVTLNKSRIKTKTKHSTNTINDTKISNLKSNKITNGNINVYSDLLNFAKLTIVGIKGPKYNITDQTIYHIFEPEFFPNVDSDDDWLIDINEYLDQLFQQQQQQQQQKNLPNLSNGNDGCSGGLIITPLLQKLLNNFINQSNEILNFNRMGFQFNYIDIFIIPFIQRIFGELICWDFNDIKSTQLNKSLLIPQHGSTDDNPNDSEEEEQQEEQDDDDEIGDKNIINIDVIFRNIKLIIVYLVLSLSSFQLSTPINNRFNLDDYLLLSIHLRKLAMKMLNYHLDESDTIIEQLEQEQEKEEQLQNTRWRRNCNLVNDYSCYILLALILQIEIDTYLSIFENYELIYAIGDFIIEKTNPKSKSSSTTTSNTTTPKKKKKLSPLLKLLINIFKIKYIFYESTHSINLFNYQINQQDEEINYRDLNENYDLISTSSLSDNENEEEEEEEEEEEDKRQIKPTIKNLIISNDSITTSYEPMSYTISFNKDNSNSLNNAKTKKQQQKTDKTIKTGKENTTTTTTTTTVVGGGSGGGKKFIPNDNFTNELDINYIYLMYGIPKSLIDLFYEIIHLTNHKNIFHRRKVFPRNFPKICAEFEDRLINWSIDNDLNWQLIYTPITTTTTNNDGSFLELLRLNIISFHQSLIIYYNQLLKKNCKLKDYQDLIEDNLNNFQKLLSHHKQQLKQKQKQKQKLFFKPLIWILFIIGSSTINPSIQNQIKSIWQSIENDYKFGVANYWRCKQILYEIWNQREINNDNNNNNHNNNKSIIGNLGNQTNNKNDTEGDENLGFMSMIREYGIVLNLG